MTVTSLSLPLAYKQLFGYKKIKDNKKVEHKHKKTQPQQKNHWNERRQFVECVRSTFNAKYSSALPMRQTINRKLRSASIDLLLLAFAYEAKAMALNESKQIKKKTKWIVERRAREPAVSRYNNRGWLWGRCFYFIYNIFICFTYLNYFGLVIETCSFSLCLSIAFICPHKIQLINVYDALN